MKQTQNNYIVYAITIIKDGKPYVYIGSGDDQELIRREYDFRNKRFISEKARNIDGECPISRCLYACPTRKMAIGVENEIINLYKDRPGLLNVYNAKRSQRYGRNSKKVRKYVSDFLCSLAFIDTFSVFMESEMEMDDWMCMKRLTDVFLQDCSK